MAATGQAGREPQRLLPCVSLFMHIQAVMNAIATVLQHTCTPSLGYTMSSSCMLGTLSARSHTMGSAMHAIRCTIMQVACHCAFALHTGVQAFRICMCNTASGAAARPHPSLVHFDTFGAHAMLKALRTAVGLLSTSPIVMGKIKG